MAITSEPARAEYVRAYLLADENAGPRNDQVAYSCTLAGKRA